MNILSRVKGNSIRICDFLSSLIPSVTAIVIARPRLQKAQSTPLNAEQEFEVQCGKIVQNNFFFFPS